MKTALEHSLAYGVNSMLTSNLSSIIISQKVCRMFQFRFSSFNIVCVLTHQNVSQFQSDLATIENTHGNVMTDTIVHFGYVYDAIWTIALALNSSISILEDRGLGRLENFTYDSVEMANVFTEAVSNVSFEGISVRLDLSQGSQSVLFVISVGHGCISTEWRQDKSFNSNGAIQKYIIYYSLCNQITVSYEEIFMAARLVTRNEICAPHKIYYLIQHKYYVCLSVPPFISASLSLSNGITMEVSWSTLNFHTTRILKHEVGWDPPNHTLQ